MMVFIGIVGAFVLTVLCSYLFVRTYSDPRQRECMTSCPVSFSLSTMLFCLLLVPVDIFVVSYGLNPDGTHSHLDVIQQTSDSFMYLYIAMYGLLLVFAFLVLPFAYFYFEEDSDEESDSSRAWGAFKYTIGFVIVCVVLLVLGIVLMKNKGHASEDWISDLTSTYTDLQGSLFFVISVLSVIGLTGWVIYTAYGMASLPIELMKQRDPSRGCCFKKQVSESEVRENERRLRLLRENQRFLAAGYDANEGMASWSRQDRNKFNQLKREEQTLTQNEIEILDIAEGGDCFDTAWAWCVPFRCALAVVFLATSLLIWLSMVLSSVDKLQHSECKAACGYAVERPTYINPIDWSLNLLSRAFPFDFLFFGFLAVYMFLCTVHGLVMAGVRLCGFKIYSIKSKKTMPHALVLGAWLLMFVVLVVNLQVLNLSPQYATFGTQYYLSEAEEPTNDAYSTLLFDPSPHTPPVPLASPPVPPQLLANGTSPAPTPAGGHHWHKTACTASYSFEHRNATDTCMMTKAATVIYLINYQYPFFGTILFWANVTFCVVYAVCWLVVLLRSKQRLRRSDSYLFDDI